VLVLAFSLTISAEEPLPIDEVPSSDILLLAIHQQGLSTDQQVTPACRTCHQDTNSSFELGDGTVRSARIDVTVLDGSAHGVGAESPLQCSDCHRSVNDYQIPHTPVTAANAREYGLENSANCQSCHIKPHLTSHPDESQPNYVSCTDCHGGHDVQTSAELLNGAGLDTCIDCHIAADVPEVDSDRLDAVIRGGLFKTRTDNGYCLSCHILENRQLLFDNGDTVSSTIDRWEFTGSVHGSEVMWESLQCTDCHEDMQYPHEPVAASTYREYSLDHYSVCIDCHQTNHENTLTGVHNVALNEGNLNAAVCTDCHGAHDTPHPSVPRTRIAETCQNCHSTIYDDYINSIHGEALVDGDPNVPTCTSCHGVHKIDDPTTALFRVRSPELCADCHADEPLMSQYDISTAVFDTYVADFHGTTVTLFEHQDPTVETNKAVCYDCHGVHDIKATDDPEVGIKENLLLTCQQCHPDASASFPDSWTSHFEPSLQNNPLVYLINLFYWIVIPGTLVITGVIVGSDVVRRVRMLIGRKS
jgi:predicted CXXCH cytochrome family protein